MKCLFILLFFFSIRVNIFSQSFLDLDKIKNSITDSNSLTFYASLIEKFNTNPSIINVENGTLLYYGKLFSKVFKPYKINFDEIEFSKLVSRRKYKQAIPKGEDLIKHDPINLEILSELSVCYKKAGLTDQANLTEIKVGLLMSSILTYGSGLSKENTLKVITVGDEYAMMGMLGIVGVTRNSLMSAKSILDTWEAKNKNGKRIGFFVEVLNNLQALR